MSPQFHWLPEYAIGNPEIDAQHRMLFDLANRIFRIMDPRQDFKELKATLQSLFEYMHVHFDAEEELMREWGYPDIDYHRNLHELIRRDMNSLVEGVYDLHRLKGELNVLMTQWVLVHIRDEDSKLGSFHRSHTQTKGM
ncbi:hemerythrin family protein [Desulfobotulus sp. H1]|uniref:Hemerythrin family protein n=1 Tax=Desulfobotulus pelophilus TaxID=2823377 RepID=A0ABT3NAA7_9BACT|nr:hemerythrin family protein [Desulfobotulus pelophilus]